MNLVEFHNASSAPQTKAEGRIDNRVRIPDGTAAVSAEVRFDDGSQSLGNWEGMNLIVGKEGPGGVSQKTCLELAPITGYDRRGIFATEKRP